MLIVRSILMGLLLFVAGVNAPASAAPPAEQVAAGAESAAVAQDLLTPAATRLCGRTLGGRCTKGRAACSKGDAAACAKWTAWSEACSKCAAAFAKCRSNPRKSCERCIAAHDACEAKAR